MFDLEAGRPALSEQWVAEIEIEEDLIAQAVAATEGGEEFQPCLFGVQRRVTAPSRQLGFEHSG